MKHVEVHHIVSVRRKNGGRKQKKIMGKGKRIGSVIYSLNFAKYTIDTTEWTPVYTCERTVQITLYLLI